MPPELHPVAGPPTPEEPPAPTGTSGAPLLRHPIAVGLALIAVVALLRASWVARDILLAAFLGVLIAVLMDFPVRLFSRWLPRGVAVLITLVLMGGVGVGLGAISIPPLIEQGRELVAKMPAVTERLRHLYAQVTQLGTGADGADLEKIESQLQASAPDLVSEVVSRAVPAAMSSLSLLSACVLVLVLAAFLVYRPDSYRRGLRSLVPVRHEPAFDGLWERLGNQLRHWLGGMLVSMAIMGTLAAIGLALVGIDQWAMLGALTFFGTFVPYLGAFVSAIPGLALGLAESTTMFFAVAGVYLGVHIVEGYLVQPFIMKRAVEIRPAALLFCQAVSGALFGVGGIVVATPLLVCLKVTVNYLYVERTLGKDVG